MTTVLAVDLGSASGRVLAGTLHDGRLDVTDIHRFKHEARRREDGTLTWDVATMEAETITGLKKALEQFPDARAVSIDTWGVDWAPLDENGELVGDVIAYRDERTSRTLDAFRDRIGDREFFDLTGTANQIFAYLQENPADAQRVAAALFLPDYFAYRLTGVVGWSRTIASTSGLLTPGGGDFNDEVFNRLGIPRGWFGDLSADRTVVGPCTVPGLETLTVVRGGAHDSACAVHGLPIEEGKRAYFLSCGSWSVLGAIEDQPLMSDAAFDLGITNEGRTDGGVRPLFNITGMWILQEIQRQWEREGTPTDTDELVAQARELPAASGVFDPDEEAFATPGDMQRKIDEALDAQGAARPDSMAGYVRVIIESFARRYARAIGELTEATGLAPDQLNLVGGGARNRLLCDLTAQISGVTVVRGPIEASTFGSLLAQLETIGALAEEDRATVIAASAATHVHVPTRS